MTLLVHTARIDFDGPNRLDVTRQSADEIGKSFAPSWMILRPVLAARRHATELTDAAKEIDQRESGVKTQQASDALGAPPFR